MGGLVIETVRPGVQFVPDAAAAFRRAEAQVRAERGRNIDVNSTFRSWSTQLQMFNAWNAYVAGKGPYPGHSKALHPDDPLAFHTKGTAVDSDDWVDEAIVEILAENGFIRNRLYVPNERHHFEYIRARDKNYGKPIAAGVQAPKPIPFYARPYGRRKKQTMLIAYMINDGRGLLGEEGDVHTYLIGPQYFEETTGDPAANEVSVLVNGYDANGKVNNSPNLTYAELYKKVKASGALTAAELVPYARAAARAAEVK